VHESTTTTPVKQILTIKRMACGRCAAERFSVPPRHVYRQSCTLDLFYLACSNFPGRGYVILRVWSVGSVRISASPPQRAAGTRLDPGRLEGRPAGGVGRRRSGECAVGVPSGRGTRAERSVERDSVYMYTRPSSLALGHKPTWLLCGGAAPCTASPPKALSIEKAFAFVTRRWMRPHRRPCRCHRRACRARIQYACP